MYLVTPLNKLDLTDTQELLYPYTGPAPLAFGTQTKYVLENIRRPYQYYKELNTSIKTGTRTLQDIKPSTCDINPKTTWCRLSKKPWKSVTWGNRSKPEDEDPNQIAIIIGTHPPLHASRFTPNDRSGVTLTRRARRSCRYQYWSTAGTHAYSIKSCWKWKGFPTSSSSCFFLFFNASSSSSPSSCSCSCTYSLYNTILIILIPLPWKN